MSRSAVLLLLFFIVVTIFAEPLITNGLSLTSENKGVQDQKDYSSGLIYGGDSFLANSYLPKIGQSKIERPELLKAVVTAYSSSPDETKPDNPYITASGVYVRPGVAASNFLPIGTKLRFPKLFPEQIFVIEDRMSKRYNNRIDIWMPSKTKALDFGLRVSDVEVF